ncbi:MULTISPECIES: dihydrolipoyl dehydrogenase [unclassified Mycoplasma]|uniref:dihydrolipoyl dehydrogenase n=1 Tax=unclassified Mycoplasma TaxID=2683645 RepID=UPI00211C2EC3|nr:MULTISPECIES: dihydrolipoyl dehydrogenase [unclassified Mycoplasma]UUM19574.1 dihydrolipoyl dehydrogenase [Mycoplasma sp. 1578d]UUM24493.1 dihydrolipoyl dehydrogenase [Mycoplasma sp. 3686d]
MYKFQFADIGEGLHEGTVAEIYVKVGQEVKEGDNLFSVETDKVTSDITTPVNGKIVQIMMAVGDVIHVGQEIFLIDDGSGDSAEAPAPASEKEPAKEEKPSEGGASVVGESVVNNDLIDLNFFKKAAPIVQEKPKSPEPTQPTTIATSGDVKPYTGKVDEEYDVIVVGSGPGGYLAAEEAGKSGLKTLIIEKVNWGGVCLNTGCIPTKTLLKTADIVQHIKHSGQYGIVLSKEQQVSEDETWVAMHKRKADVVSKISMGVQMLMKASKAKTLVGEAKVIGDRVVQVEGKVYRAKHLILATGSSANKLMKIPGFEQGYKDNKIITSKEAINWSEKRPKSVTIIGGGVIGLEFASIFSVLGTKVTIIQNTDRLLPTADKEVSVEVAKMLKNLGVEVLFDAQTQKFENDKLYVEVKGEQKVLEQELILTATGRTPNTQGLEEAGIKLGSRGEVLVNEHMQTNVPGVYAIGDMTGQAMLAHVAYAHAMTAVFNILGDEHKGIYKPKSVAGCIYTSPEIAFIGLTEEQALAQGKNVFSSKYSFERLGKAIASVNNVGFVKLIVDKEFGEILGAWMVGPNVTDYVAEIAVAMEQELSVHEIAHTIHPHPTYGEIIWEAARAASLKLSLESMKR